MSLNLVGIATKPQALKGQFRIKPNINNFKMFKKLSTLTIDNKEYKLESVIIRDTFVIVKLEGIDTCEMAETFRNKSVYADIEVEVVESSFDLTSFFVLLDSEEIGKIVEVNNYGSKDILSISGSKNLMLPVVDGLIVNIDEKNRQVILDKNIFEQVVVYED